MFGQEIIKAIKFNVTRGGATYTDVTLEYDYEGNYPLTLEDIHQEDNDSWCMARVGDEVFNFQVFGDDESLGLKSNLNINGCKMEYDADNDCYNHTDYWLYGGFSNLRIITTSGTKKVKLTQF